MAEPQVDFEATTPRVTAYANGARRIRIVAMPEEFLARLEAALGKIELGPMDLDTPLSEAVPTPYRPEQYAAAILDSQNAHPADLVASSPLVRIVISFGAAHETGWLAELQARDAGWVRLEG